MPHTLIYPMFAMVLLTFFVLGWMFKSRVSAVRQGQVDARYFKSFEGPTPPSAVTNSGRHFTNLFEVPVIFYVGCLTAMVLQVQGSRLLLWAWGFVAARVVHALIHLGSNRLRPRMLSFGVGCLFLLIFWVDLTSSWFLSTLFSQLN